MTRVRHHRRGRQVVKGEVTVTPQHDDCRFEPEHQLVTGVGSNVDVEFTGVLTYTVSRSVVDDDGDPVPGVSVSFAGAAADVQTDANGAWE